jgi:hypothetical protein
VHSSRISRGDDDKNELRIPDRSASDDTQDELEIPAFIRKKIK